MSRMLLGAFLAALAMFFFGYIYWGMLPTGQMGFERPADEAALTEALRAHLPTDGAYYLPGPPPAGDAGAMEAWTANHAAGPIAMISVRTSGATPMSPVLFASGFVHMLISCLILGGLLFAMRDRLPTFATRFAVAAIGGIAGATYAHLGDPIWWYTAWDFGLLKWLYDSISWVFAGAILARFVRSA
ncbi:MAG: hypothetical protein AAF772_17430 [Acidobacteriota bacterium]